MISKSSRLEHGQRPGEPKESQRRKNEKRSHGTPARERRRTV